MDNRDAILCVLQMAKAWQSMQADAGLVPDQYDEEAVLRVEEMLNDGDQEAA